MRNNKLNSIMELLKNNETEKAIKLIEAIDRNNIAVWWHIDDVRQRDNGMHDFTDIACNEILTAIEKAHDCNCGIDWDNIQYNIDDYCEKNSIPKKGL